MKPMLHEADASTRPSNASPPRGRYAPSPTGRIHVGNARTALAAWLSVRSRGGAFVWRLEDLDPPRVVPGAAVAALADLRWFGLDWDEGPDVGGPFGPYIQSLRSTRYETALRYVLERGRLFPCTRSRKELQAVSSAPHGPDGQRPYPASLRPARLEAGWYDHLERADPPGATLRFLVRDGTVAFTDQVLGRQVERVSETTGDFILKRRDGLYAYQLAVVVDDLAMDITEVVRGVDLLDSTGRQLQLIEALGGTAPAYAHVPLVLNADREKLSKRDEGLTLQSLREDGVRPEQLAGYLAWSLGLLDRPRSCRPCDLIDGFTWECVSRDDWVLPDDLATVLLALK